MFSHRPPSTPGEIVEFTKHPDMSIWPAIYLALAAAAAIAPSTLPGVANNFSLDPGIRPFLVFVAMPLQAVFVAAASYRSLVRRTSDDQRRAQIWQSPPTNPQSNQLAQILGFGCFGISAAFFHPDAALRVFGLFGVWLSAALLVSLLGFRMRHVRAARR